MPSTAEEVYNEIIQALPPTERLRLATLILNELVQRNSSIDESDAWTDLDRAEMTQFSLQYATSLFPDEEAV